MTLLGTPLLVLLGFLTLAAPVVLCLLWSRVRGPAVVRVAQRAALLVVAQLVAIALVAAAINDYGLFYKDWSELASGARQIAGFNTTPATDLPPSAAERDAHLKLTSTFEPGYGNENQWPRTGRLEVVTIHGAMSGLSEPALVYLPPEYFQPQYARKYFPAAEVFTGYPGVDSYLVSRLKYPTVLRHLLRIHRASPVVLVMMRPAVTFPRDTECTDVPGGPSALSYFDTDVPTAIEATYRVLASGWGAVGDSTGGYCATKLAMFDPMRFRAAAEMSGYFYALHDNTTGDLWGGSPVVRNLNDLAWRLKHQPMPPIYLLEGTSPTERGSDGYDEALRFLRLIRRPMQVSLMTVPHGGHNIATWSAELPAALTWLTGHLPAVSDSASPHSPGMTDLGTATAPQLPPQRP